jgi:uncharacterized protein YbaR (Trm112 family)
MKMDLMKILACPICKSEMLELIIFEKQGEEVETGLIICQNCSRFYPIKKTIPIMLPDDLRDLEEDREFLDIHKESIPENILRAGKPISLQKKNMSS